jgi:copper resistance protein B
MTVGPDGRRLPQQAPPAAALTGPEHAADVLFDPLAMAQARAGLLQMHGAVESYKVLLDRAEVSVADGHESYSWDAQAWYGADINKLWLKTEGEGEFGGELEQVEVQALFSRAVDPWFDIQLGVRHDFRVGPERTYLVAGVQGLAPYWFEIDGAVFLSDRGDVTARVKGEYDLRITQRLILQPSAEIEFSLQDVPELGIGAGLSSAEIGARLRYEISRQFAPYVGVELEQSFGGTRDFNKAAGRDSSSLNAVIGIRAWF